MILVLTLMTSSTRAITPKDNYPHNPYLWVVVLRGNCPTNRGSCPRGNCPTGVMVLGGSCPGGNCPWGSRPMGVIVLWGSCPQGSCPQGSCPRGSCPRGSCPRTVKHLLRSYFLGKILW